MNLINTTTMEQNKKYEDLLKKVKHLYNSVNGEWKHIISEYIPEVLIIDDNNMLKEIMIYLDWLDGKKDCAPKGEYSIKQMVKWLRDNMLDKQIAMRSSEPHGIELKFVEGDVMRTKEEAAHGIRDGLPVVVSMDVNNYYCTNETIPVKEQDEYEYPPMNRPFMKFCFGDYIVSNNGKHRGFITKIDDCYIVHDECGVEIPVQFSEHYMWHKWTQQDVRDGDVIASGNLIILFKEWENDSDFNFLIAYAGLDVSGKLQVTDEHWLISSDAKPATQEQKTSLFTALYEHSYIWDDENKRLFDENKLSEFDRDMIDKTIWKLQDMLAKSLNEKLNSDIRDNITWLKNFKQRIQ